VGINSDPARWPSGLQQRNLLAKSNLFQETIPVKWMSPEQLNLNAGQRRKYNNKTDVWSFGVTLWEIFSKGERQRPLAL